MKTLDEYFEDLQYNYNTVVITELFNDAWEDINNLKDEINALKNELEKIKRKNSELWATVYNRG